MYLFLFSITVTLWFCFYLPLFLLLLSWLCVLCDSILSFLSISIIFYFFKKTDVLRVCNIHLQLIQVYFQVILYYFLGSVSDTFFLSFSLNVPWGMWDLSSQPGIKPGSLQWKHWVLTPEPPGNFLIISYNNQIFLIISFHSF